MLQRRIAYFECGACGSLQTQRPDWLDQAYAADDNALDVGRAQRNLMTAMFCSYILQKVNLGSKSPCLDWGGGEGLFCRFMRDRGFNFFLYDAYATPLYAIPYSISDPESIQPQVVTAFEVFEHLPEPRRDLELIFRLKPRFLFFSTEVYSDQGSDWQYLSLYGGKHVFFYSERALEWIAQRFGYSYHRLQFLHMFISNDPASAAQRAVIAEIASASTPFLTQAAESLLNHLSNDAWQHIQADYLDLRVKRLGH